MPQSWFIEVDLQKSLVNINYRNIQSTMLQLTIDFMEVEIELAAVLTDQDSATQNNEKDALTIFQDLCWGNFRNSKVI